MIRGKPPLPVDRGWAWLVMIGAFINITIVISFNRASGLFVTYFLDQFQESATSTTMAFGAAPLMFSICNILLPTVLLPRFCPRTLAFAGGVFTGISVTSMAFARSMLTMTFLFGIMGFAHGLIFVPQTVLIGFYFKKRLAFANAFACMGMATAAIFSPILGRFLLDGFGLQGTLLLYGAFTFNILPSALLFRPVSSYSTISANDSPSENGETQVECTSPLLNQDLEQPPEHDISPSSMNSEKHQSYQISRELNNQDKCTKDEQIGENTNADESRQNHTNEISMQQLNFKEPTNLQQIFLRRDNSSVDLHLEKDSMQLCLSHYKEPGHYLNYKSKDTENVCVSHTPSSALTDEPLCSPAEAQEIVLPKEDLIALRELDHEKDCPPATPQKGSPHSNCKSCWSRHFRSILAWTRNSIYSNPIAILLLLASGFCVHTQPSFTYLPSLGEENGLSSREVPYLLTTAGVFNLLGKLVIGYIADLSFCSTSRLHMLVAINLVLGIALQFTRYAMS